MRKLTGRLIVYLNIALAAAMLLGVSAMYIKPSLWILPSFATLIFPFLAAANLVFLVVYAYYKRKYFLISLLALLLSWPALVNTFSFQLPAKKAENEFRLVSYNVRLFNLYDWIEGINAGNEILALIKRESPDILCLQEFYSKAGERDLIDEIMQAGNYRQYYCPGYNEGKSYGSAIFSRYPISNYGNFSSDASDNTFVFADIEIYGRTLRMYSLHLASLYLSRDDYRFIDNMGENSRSETVKGLGGIFKKMSYAYKKRPDETETILLHAENSDLPVVLCGDFNDVPVSYAYRKFSASFDDAFQEAGFGVGNTYRYRFLRFRIDYVFYNEPLKALNFRVLREHYSDHYPVIVDFAI